MGKKAFVFIFVDSAMKPAVTIKAKLYYAECQRQVSAISPCKRGLVNYPL